MKTICAPDNVACLADSMVATLDRTLQYTGGLALLACLLGILLAALVADLGGDR